MIVFYQFIRRFISTVMFGTDSLRSWRICMSIFLASSGTPSGCDRLVESQQSQGDPNITHYGICHILQKCTSITQLNLPLRRCRQDSFSQIPSCESGLPFLTSFGDVFCSCSSLVENMLTNISASSWGRIRIVLAPRWICQGCMALAIMGASFEAWCPHHLLMSGCYYQIIYNYSMIFKVLVDIQTQKF